MQGDDEEQTEDISHIQGVLTKIVGNFARDADSQAREFAQASRGAASRAQELREAAAREDGVAATYAFAAEALMNLSNGSAGELDRMTKHIQADDPREEALVSDKKSEVGRPRRLPSLIDL